MFKPPDTFFKSKTIAITGGTSGIGLEMVRILLASGARISTCSHKSEEFDSVRNEFHSPDFLFTLCDVSNEDQCRDFIENTEQKLGPVDILINNAGITMYSEFVDTEISVLEKMMSVNYFGAVYCTKYALPSVIKQKGCIVGLSSVGGIRGLPGRTGYSASKFALIGFYESLRTELLTGGVHVMWACPVFIRTPIRASALDGQGQPRKISYLAEEGLMPAKECAIRILNALVHKRRSVIVGSEGIKARWINFLFPNWADRLTRKRFYVGDRLVR